MLMHAMAPARVAAPPLYAQWTWVKELGVGWSDIGGIDHDEIGHLVELINIEREAAAMKARVTQAGRRRR